MITRTQIFQIKKCQTIGEVFTLLRAFENELLAKELTSNKVLVVVSNMKGDAFEDVAAHPVGKSFAYHKAVFGHKGWTLTHLKSGKVICTFARKHLLAFISDMLNADWFIEVDEFMQTHDDFSRCPQIEEFKKLYFEYKNAR